MDDRAEHVRIATVRGSTLSDTAHYAAAVATLRDAESLASRLARGRNSGERR
jgi:hypothetical protein